MGEPLTAISFVSVGRSLHDSLFGITEMSAPVSIRNWLVEFRSTIRMRAIWLGFGCGGRRFRGGIECRGCCRRHCVCSC